MIQYRIRLTMEMSDGDTENSTSEETTGDNLNSVVDEAIAKLGDWQRYQDRLLEEGANILPEEE